MDQICTELDAARIVPSKPKCIVAHTTKGQGVSFMANNVAWHHKVPNEKEFQQAMAELKQAAI
jgi:transketolase